MYLLVRAQQSLIKTALLPAIKNISYSFSFDKVSTEMRRTRDQKKCALSQCANLTEMFN